MPTKQQTKLGANNWIAVVLLAFSGQIAWVIENNWFNTFVNDVISPNPKVISLMVALSAVTATLTTLIMGTLSDRLGKRKAIILVSYILWGHLDHRIPHRGVDSLGHRRNRRRHRAGLRDDVLWLHRQRRQL